MKQARSKHPRIRRKPCPLRGIRRRGAIYIVVLGISAILATLAISLLALARQRDRQLSAINDSDEAGVIAQSAVEDVLTRIQGSTTWRTTYTNNVQTSAATMGRGTYYWKFVDPVNGNLTTSNFATTRLYAYGHVKNAYRCYSVSIGAIKPVTALAVAVDASGTTSLSSLGATGNCTISCNSNLSVSSSAMNAICIEAANFAIGSGNSGTGTLTTLTSSRTFPDSTHVFDYYVANGLSTSAGSIGKTGGVITINHALWTPTNNPYGGGTSSNGIYYVNCGGSNVSITDSRLVGTFVFQNAGTVTVSNSCLWEPATTGYPALLVQGNLAISISGSLSETAAATNFNPAGSPYPYNGGASGGVSNTTTTDSWASRFSGLAYCTGNLTTSGNATIKGVLIANGTWTATGSLALYYDPVYFYTVPPGFTDALHLAPISGSWQWEIAQ